jgi:hypothetical protein
MKRSYCFLTLSIVLMLVAFSGTSFAQARTQIAIQVEKMKIKKADVCQDAAEKSLRQAGFVNVGRAGSDTVFGYSSDDKYTAAIRSEVSKGVYVVVVSGPDFAECSKLYTKISQHTSVLFNK